MCKQAIEYRLYTYLYTAIETIVVFSSTSHFNSNHFHYLHSKCNSQPSYPSLPSWLPPRLLPTRSLSKSYSLHYTRPANSFRRGQLGTLLEPTLEGLQPTVAGLGLGVLNPTVAGLKSTVDVAKRGALGTLLDPSLEANCRWTWHRCPRSYRQRSSGHC